MQDLSSFTLLTSEGEEKEYQVLFSFVDDETRKRYIVYTDHTFDSSGCLNVFANIYENFVEDIVLYPVTTRAEWKTIESVMSILNQDGQFLPDEKVQMVLRDELSVSSFPLLQFKDKGIDRLLLVLSMFKDLKTQREYIVATDDVSKSDGTAKIYVGRVEKKDLKDQPVGMKAITDPEEWKRIRQTISSILTQLGRHLSA